ncbi:gliding motility-associated ABC transporter substrate-binding protein GldG [Aquimarina intermedia]|uniref:Protein involved in gliding motility GldG n=1 Tax=Aquimarina intermedia TaxID=350814 RepID=A0A5S5BYW9_9FLAO|nr:gliding motility-associated ABC transporter substrate-binding protein GldG [Aquimarina intermedia]TYP72139.1 protein involved in gliding motility GldG [Aquimarina intermedia]
MIAILQKEFNSFFTSTIGYLIIAVFLTISGLFLWVFKGPYNVFDSGFADLTPYFELAPWVLLVLVPAITMRSFAEEKKQGTFELLLTKPLTLLQIVLGKVLGNFLLILVALLPTLLYLFTIFQLKNSTDIIDIGSFTGSFIGLLLLSALYTGIGVFCSALTDNQITAFISTLLGCFIMFFGFDALASLIKTDDFTSIFNLIGIQLHYDRISRGVLDTRDILYFLSVIVAFVWATIVTISKRGPGKKIKLIAGIAIGLVVINTITTSFYQRFDLTYDQRFTLSEATTNLLEDTAGIVTIDVLLKGDFPSEFKRLQAETQQLLEEFSAHTNNLQYAFTNPLEEVDFQAETLQQLQEFGLTPMEVSVQENGKTNIETLVPWAILSYQNKSVKVQLIKNTIGATSEERVNASIQQLEYTFADALTKLLHPKKHKIAVLKGNGQLPDVHVADFIKTLQEYYFVGAFTLDSVSSNPQKTLTELKEFDLIINAKPTEAFTEKEKLVMDQFVMNGGKSIWLTETVSMELDSLFNPSGSALAMIQDLRLGDMFFSYGARINPVLVNDLYSAPIVLAAGETNETQFTPYPWFFSSLTKPTSEHPIVKNIEAVKFEFSNQIDTLANAIDKTILLSSSAKSKLEGIPQVISLDIIRQKPNLNTYTEGPQNLAVLLEGSFKSTYNNRVKPFTLDSIKEQSEPTAMIIVADGDVIKNSTRKNQPVPLGYDPYMNLQYGNKEFLLNAVNYLLDDSGLMTVRGRKVNVAFLDIEKVVADKTTYQLLNLGLPLLLLASFGFLFSFLRKRKYQR